MRADLTRYVPPGVNFRVELKWLGTGLLLSFFYSLIFLINYSNHYGSLFWYNGTEKVLLEGAAMPDFIEILGNSLVGFLILAICMTAVLLYHYAYYYQGSKSIYLMKRLPSRRELWRRCVIFPVLAVAVCLFFAFLLLLIYFEIYIAFTPKACLTPDQWQKAWHVMLGAAL